MEHIIFTVNVRCQKFIRILLSFRVYDLSFSYTPHCLLKFNSTMKRKTHLKFFFQLLLPINGDLKYFVQACIISTDFFHIVKSAKIYNS